MRLLITMLICYAFSYALNIMVSKCKELKNLKKKAQEVEFNGVLKEIDTEFWEDLESEDISTKGNK